MNTGAYEAIDSKLSALRELAVQEHERRSGKRWPWKRPDPDAPDEVKAGALRADLRALIADAYDAGRALDSMIRLARQLGAVEEWTEYLCSGCGATYSARPFAIPPHRCAS